MVDKYDFLEVLGILTELKIDPGQVAAWRAAAPSGKTSSEVVVKAPEGGPGGDPDKSTVTFTGVAMIMVNGMIKSTAALTHSGKLEMDAEDEGKLVIDITIDGHEDHMIGSQSFKQSYSVSWDVAAAKDGTLTIMAPPQETIPAPKLTDAAYRLEGGHPDTNGKSFVQIAPVVLSGSNSVSMIGIGNQAAPAIIKETFRFDVSVKVPEQKIKIEIGPVTAFQNVEYVIGPFKVGNAHELEKGSVDAMVYDFFQKELPAATRDGMIQGRLPDEVWEDNKKVQNGTLIETHGYTSNTDSAQHNLKLSLDRAAFVVNEFGKMGVPSSLFTKPIPHGEWATSDDSGMEPTDDRSKEKESPEWRKVVIKMVVAITSGSTHEI
jgi:hypothetical protein